VDPAAIERSCLQLEHDWATAAVTHNAEAVRRVEADDIIVTYIDGSTGTKADDIRDIESGALTAEAWELADVKVKVLDADAAVVTGRGIIKNGKYKGLTAIRSYSNHTTASLMCLPGATGNGRRWLHKQPLSKIRRRAIADGRSLAIPQPISSWFALSCAAAMKKAIYKAT